MTKLAELGYLVRIELLDKGIITEQHAIRGDGLEAMLRRDAPSYIGWMGEEKFRRYFEFAIMKAENIRDHEIVERLSKQHRIHFVCDSEVHHYNPEILYRARYWIWNGNKRGKTFYCGINERTMRGMNEGSPLKNINDLSRVVTDDDFWGFVNTWLEKKWRTK